MYTLYTANPSFPTVDRMSNKWRLRKPPRFWRRQNLGGFLKVNSPDTSLRRGSPTSRNLHTPLVGWSTSEPGSRQNLKITLGMQRQVSLTPGNAQNITPDMPGCPWRVRVGPK